MASRVNQAVTHLDQMTQQNAALVEESTAAAASMRDQAQHLADVIAVFNVGAMPTRAPAAPRAAPLRPAPPAGSEGGGVLGATAGVPGAYGQTCGGGPRQRRPHQPLLPHCRNATRAQGGSRRG